MVLEAAMMIVRFCFLDIVCFVLLASPNRCQDHLESLWDRPSVCTWRMCWTMGLTYASTLWAKPIVYSRLKHFLSRMPLSTSWCYRCIASWGAPFFFSAFREGISFTRLHLLFLHACPNKAIFRLIIWARSSSLFWSPSNMLLFVLFSVQLIRSNLRWHHISAASNRLSSSFFKVNHSTPYVMTGHMSAFTNFILSSFRIALSFQIAYISMVAFLALPILALMSSEFHRRRVETNSYWIGDTIIAKNNHTRPLLLLLDRSSPNNNLGL